MSSHDKEYNFEFPRESYPLTTVIMISIFYKFTTEGKFGIYICICLYTKRQWSILNKRR